MNSIIKIILLIFIIIFVSGCATTNTIKTKVTVFNNIPKARTNTKNQQFNYSFKKNNQNDSLEYKAYLKKFERYLKKNNFILKENAKYIVDFNYFVDNGTLKVGSYPIYGTVGYQKIGKFSSPIIGVVGSLAYSYTLYKKKLNFYIFDKQLNQNIYEAQVVLTGKTDTILDVIDEMIASIFINFPGKNETTKIVEVPLKK